MMTRRQKYDAFTCQIVFFNSTIIFACPMRFLYRCLIVSLSDGGQWYFAGLACLHCCKIPYPPAFNICPLSDLSSGTLYG